MLSVLLVVFSAVSLAAVSLVLIVDSATRAFVDSSPMLKHLLEIGIVGAVLGILSCAVLRLRNKDTGMTKATRRFFHAVDVHCVWIRGLILSSGRSYWRLLPRAWPIRILSPYFCLFSCFSYFGQRLSH